MRKCKSRRVLLLLLATFVVLLLFVANIFFGSVDIPFADVFDILTGSEPRHESWRLILVQSRLPQAVVALFGGMALSAAGLMLQTLFNNPLAGPEVFGINSGAGLGVAVVMLLLQGTFVAGTMSIGGYMAVLAGAFLGAIFIIGVILLFSTLLRGNIFLLIAGMALSYLTSSLISLLNYFSTAEGVHSYLIWGMGNFGGVSTQQLPVFVTLAGVSLLMSLLMMKPLNALLLGNAYAANLGVKTKRVRALLLLLTGFLTAIVTAYCGPITFVGLAVPHVARLLLKNNNHRILLPMTILLGGATTLLCNIICQLPGESGLVPLGAVTPLLGAPVIIYVVLKNRGIYS
ncbi:MAG: iron ABC transporter permease [Bacteroidaceae bacterium]|nr:iron ABC transporter permease [Bacteroidaceae bacterium]MBQ5705549.1 iron ABC transporter permease [Bacteroidaceae bacterium]